MTSLDEGADNSAANSSDDGAALPLAAAEGPISDRPDPIARRRHGHVGQAVSRLDGPAKVAGAAPFAAEYAPPGLAFAALAFSTIARGRILSIDTSAATALPGVLLVMTHENAPALRPPPRLGEHPKAAAADGHRIMQDDRIHWNGQPIAVIVADSQEQAEHGASLVTARYEEEEVALTDVDLAAEQHSFVGEFMGETLSHEAGDAEAALAAAPVRVDIRLTTPRHNHNAIEPHAVTVVWDGDRLHVHDASQAVAHSAWTLAHILGLGDGQVTLTSPFVGGGFGGKMLWQHQALAAAAARLAGRPLRLALSREGVFRVVGGRSPTEQRVALGADHDGRLRALIHTGLTPKTAVNDLPEPFISPAKEAYAVPAMRLEVRAVELDMISNTWMRAPGEAVGTFALETAMDELAEALAMDPMALRLKNRPETEPASGKPFSAHHIAEAWAMGAQRFGWDRRQARPGSVRDGDWLIGMGCAQATYPYYRMPGGAARLTLTRDGQVIADIAANEMGMGTATAQTQILAERLALPIDAITFNYGDSTLPGAVLAGGSQQTAAVGAALNAAARALVDELLRLAGNASPLAGLAVDDVGCDDGALVALAAPDRRETFAAILTRAGRDTLSVEAEAPPTTELEHFAMHSHGAMFCEMAVHAVTGEPRVRRFLGAFDCGRIINARTAASQFRGGIIMGLGAALMEETQFDRRGGRIVNASLAEYHVPVHMDVPEIEVIWTDIPDPHTPMGARGVGEIGITGTMAAVANAVYNATGRRVRDLPITLDKLL